MLRFSMLFCLAVHQMNLTGPNTLQHESREINEEQLQFVSSFSLMTICTISWMVHADSVSGCSLLGIGRCSWPPLPRVRTLTAALWWTGVVPTMLGRTLARVPSIERDGMVSPAAKALLGPLLKSGHQAAIMHPENLRKC